MPLNVYVLGSTNNRPLRPSPVNGRTPWQDMCSGAHWPLLEPPGPSELLNSSTRRKAVSSLTYSHLLP